MRKNYRVYHSSWIKWIHTGIPDDIGIIRNEMRNLAERNGHCAKCTALSGCYFYNEDILKCPLCPLHPDCHCYKINIDYSNDIVAYCDILKFTKYIFSDQYLVNGKKNLFENLGFTISNSEYLKKEYERQAKLKYETGNYVLDKLDRYGQRINITIEFPRSNKENITFVSGWMVYPNGYIACITPLG